MAAADAALSVVVDSLVSLRRTRLLRLYFPWLFPLLSVLGSVLKDLDLVPASYFSSSRNVLNLYLVKLSWGWTLALLAPFLLLPPVLSGRGGGGSVPSSVGRHLLSLAVATSVWYVFTETFFYIEDATGFCHESNHADTAADAANDASNAAADVVMKSEFVSKAACRRAGFLWSGWDISGHCFILSYSALVIMEETTATAPVQLSGGGGVVLRRALLLLRLLYVALNLVVLTWVWMFLCTCVYFHDTQDKLLGTACGLAGWYLTYRVWYPRRWSPGLPSQRQPKERKQRA